MVTFDKPFKRLASVVVQSWVQHVTCIVYYIIFLGYHAIVMLYNIITEISIIISNYSFTSR